jgi:uncharacterized membrane protein YecN with MAPEG domain
MIPVSAIYIALNALILLSLALLVVRQRWATGVGLGPGKGDTPLARAMRCHANAAEYMPMALVTIVALELMGAPLWLLHVLGGGLTVGRAIHPFGLYRSAGRTAERFIGTLLSWLVLVTGAAALLFFALAR